MSRAYEVVVRRPESAVERQAAAARLLFGLGPHDFVNMAKLMDVVLAKHKPGYIMEVEDDLLMNGCEAVTSKTELRIVFSRSTYDGLARGNWRARMTAAHELGHLFLHCGRWWGRVKGRPSPLNDPERQADTFGAAFLMPEVAFRTVASIEEAMHKFGVTRDAAMCRARKLGLADNLQIYEAPRSTKFKKKGRKPMASTP